MTGVDQAVKMLWGALRCAGKGWRVLPLHTIIHGQCTCERAGCASPGKHPRTAHGVKEASTESRVIHGWWREWPDTNIGIATGNGLVVLDIDPPHGGDDSLADIEAKHGKLPNTVECLTGGGGRHLYFKAPDVELRNSVGKLGRGLDTRTDGGYVVAPPSMHISGRRYEWEGSSLPSQTPLAPIPGWLVDLLRVETVDRKPTGKPASEWRALVKGAAEGERNQRVAQLAGLLFRRGVDPVVALDLVAAWNDARCKPPLPDDELTATVDSIAARELRRREARHA
jgi:hypothetical protein